MGKTTEILWCDSTANLMAGCDGCELSDGHCYAQNLVGRWAGRKGYPAAFNKPELFLERLEPALRWPELTGQPRPEKPWLDGRPRLIFLNDLGDTFTESLPLDWLAPLLPRLSANPHAWLILTKRPKRFAEFAKTFGPLPRNIWGGVTVTGPKTVWRIAELLAIDLAVRFVSFEPLLGMVDLRDCDLWATSETGMLFDGADPRLDIDWAIVGGESGARARPMQPTWVRMIRDVCIESRVPFFFKQWGGKIEGRELNGREWSQVPEVTR